MKLTQAFEIPAVSAISDVPDSVVQAALGGSHSPVVPQRQRLLVAANKGVEAPKEAADVSKAGNKKTKANMAASKCKPAPKAKAKAAASDKQQNKSKRAPYPDTEYNIQRKAFFATFLI